MGKAMRRSQRRPRSSPFAEAGAQGEFVQRVQPVGLGRLEELSRRGAKRPKGA